MKIDIMKEDIFKTVEIINFFATLSEMTNLYVTAIEMKPYKVVGDTYITGFRRRGLGIVEAHVKEIKHVLVKTSDYTMGLPLRQDAEGELWLNTSILCEDTLKGAIDNIKKQFNELASYEVAELKYRLKTANKSDYITQEEVIVYADKTQACKETIKKRKNCEMFKTKFHHFGEQTQEKQKQMTTLEFAEAEL